MDARRESTSATYTCPMHPEVQQGAPGKCPKCGMDLVPKTRHDREREHEEHGAMPEMTRAMRRHWLWTNFTVIALGLLLASSHETFGYRNELGMVRGDVTCALLLIVLGAASLWPRMDFWGRWGVTFVGAWLQFAPLIFWAKNPAAYATDTFIGVWAIALSILVPMMPGMTHHMAMMKPGPGIPPGWTYNPSTWQQRAPLIALALIGWFISRYLAAVQLGYIPAAWEPFFGQGTHLVLHSKVSQMWPISDAGLGACAYTFEFLMGWMGGQTRWRSMPWMVLLFGILIVPLGLTHIVLVILQPVVVGHWCTLCLAAAFVMLLMIPLMLDEVFAMVQFMMLAQREGKPLWRTFWIGDTVQGGEKDNRTPHYGSPVLPMAPAMVWGVTTPWNLLASAALGVWLMFAPSVFGTHGAAADSDHLLGALVVTTAFIALAEVVRTGRFLNLLLGAWIIASAWVLSGRTVGDKWNDAITGTVIMVLSLPRGIVRERYGNWNSHIR